MRTKISILFFATAVLVCCKSKSKTTTSTSTSTTTTNSNSNSNNPFDPAPIKISYKPDSLDEAFAKTKWPESDLAQLNSGYKIYTANCGKCHELHKPSEYDEAKWTKIVPWMAKKAVMNEADQQLILHYLVAKHETLKSPK